MTTNAWGYGLNTITEDGTVLDAWFPHPMLGTPEENQEMPTGFSEYVDDLRQIHTRVSKVKIDTDAAPESTTDAYLRLHLISHLLVKPNQINLDGLFAQLPNVAWTTHGPVALATLERSRLQLQRTGISLVSLDKFPRLLDYVVPDRVRIADANRVRLGAYLSPGTTVMHEGFVNFNAGTLGTSMVEGRISQGVTVGQGTDIGGGASIMGTLSGGGTERVAIGERVLLGANSGVGISIGDDSIVEAGLYLTTGTKVALRLESEVRTVKAVELSGVPGMLFRRNSVSGAVEAIRREGIGVSLNQALHT